MAATLDFDSIGAAALSMAEILLPDWIGGKRKGQEWVGERKANGGLGDSWSVNIHTGKWACFSSEERGGDLISLYAALHHIEQGAACKQVAALIGHRDTPAGVPVLDRSIRETPCEPIPADAPDPRPHPQYGAPSAIYKYGDAFWICRYATPEGKTFSPFTWRGGKWVARAYPDPRPLYGAERLGARPDAVVLIVEGEKCAEAAQRLLRAYVVVTWAGGANAATKNDWKALKGREVIIWPDADDPGRQAARTIAEVLSKYATRIRIINPDRDNGWDVSDAIAEGWDSKRVAKWAGEHIRQTYPAVEEPSPAPVDEPPETPAEPPSTALIVTGSDVKGTVVESNEDASAFVEWSEMFLDTNEGGMPHATLANASAIVGNHPRLKDKIWYDRFTGKIMHTLKGGEREWSDDDDQDLTVMIQHGLKLNKFKLDIVASGVQHAARLRSRNSLTDWLNSLEWDGAERLSTWLQDCLGVERNEYSVAVSRNWPISMVARAYVPGCKVDTMPVLEGKQGHGKTSALEILGVDWYKAIPTNFGDKDFLQAIQGAWLIEIPDMTGFSRREHTQILATITIRRDEYRPSYGRRTLSHPRVAIFAASSENDNYLNDARGRRRYWPLRCEGIDIDNLRATRDQIFAEAVKCYRGGEHWYEMPVSTDDEQSARVEPDLWTDKVIDWATRLWEQRTIAGPGHRITSQDLLRDAIELPTKHQTDIEKKRIARIMRENGWIQQRDKIGRFWKKPQRRDGAYTARQDDPDIPF